MKPKLTRVSSNTTQGEVRPYDLAKEKVVLGALIINEVFRSALINILKLETFYFEGHQEIYKAILELYNTQQPVDLLTVLAQLRKNGKLESIGGIDYIEKLIGISSSPEELDRDCCTILSHMLHRMKSMPPADEDLALKDKKS